jgi:hypothetical protein
VYDDSISYVTTTVTTYNTQEDIPENTTDTVAGQEEVYKRVIQVCNLNILANEVTEVFGDADLYYAMNADIPAGSSLKVVLRSEIYGHWQHSLSEKWSISGYEITPLNNDNTEQIGEQTFTVTDAGTLNHLYIQFYVYDEILIKFYSNGKYSSHKNQTAKGKMVGHFPNLFYCYQFLKSAKSITTPNRAATKTSSPIFFIEHKKKRGRLYYSFPQFPPLLRESHKVHNVSRKRENFLIPSIHKFSSILLLVKCSSR